MKPYVYWGTLTHQDWTIFLGATEIGLCCITLPNESFETLTTWVDKYLPNALFRQDESYVLPYARQLIEYFAGYRTEFTLALDLRGTPFQRAVWTELARVPYATTATYSNLANRIGRPKAVRAVGAANGANPLPFVLPCHRIIGKNGNLTGYRGGLDVKEKLLRMERTFASLG